MDDDNDEHSKMFESQQVDEISTLHTEDLSVTDEYLHSRKFGYYNKNESLYTEKQNENRQFTFESDEEMSETNSPSPLKKNL